mmetsp:Transcript_39006/g.111475  ORF Transcript_39006/g.111475 Transcript_39006/m.111475 type:complete len:108 (-) Transcript_39006:385-708(-)
MCVSNRPFIHSFSQSRCPSCLSAFAQSVGRLMSLICAFVRQSTNEWRLYAMQSVHQRPDQGEREGGSVYDWQSRPGHGQGGGVARVPTAPGVWVSKVEGRLGISAAE